MGNDAGGGGGAGSGQSIAIRPDACESLITKLSDAGTDAGDLQGEVSGLLGEARESAPTADRILADIAAWGPSAADDLRWRVDMIVALDLGYHTPDGMISTTLPATRAQAMVEFGDEVSRQLLDELPRDEFGMVTANPDALDEAYPRLARLLEVAGRYRDDAEFAGGFFANLDDGGALEILQTINDMQDRRLYTLSGGSGGEESWLDRDVRDDLLTPLGDLFETAARADRLELSLLDEIARADGYPSHAAAGALYLEVDVDSLRNPQAQAALWSVPLGYASWPQADRYLADLWTGYDQEANTYYPEFLAKLGPAPRVALESLAAHHEAAYHALMRGPTRVRVLDEMQGQQGITTWPDQAGRVLEAGLLLYPHEQGWTGDLQATAREHPEWGEALSAVITDVAGRDGVPSQATDSLARILAPHMDDVSGIARGPDAGEVLLRFTDGEGNTLNHDRQATIMRDYLANVVEHDEGLVTFQDIIANYHAAQIGPHMADIAEGGDGLPDIGARSADVRGVYRITLDALDEAEVNWEKRNWLLRETATTVRNAAVLGVRGVAGVPGGVAGFVVGEVIARPSGWVTDKIDEGIRATGPTERDDWEAYFNSRLEATHVEMLVGAAEGLPPGQRDERMPIGPPDPMLNERSRDDNPWTFWTDESDEWSAAVDTIYEWDPDNVRAWLNENAAATGHDDPQNYWIIQEAGERTRDTYPIPMEDNESRTEWLPDYDD
ncbi:MAG: hypothetical protein ACRDU8_00015 [Egibacteraceae bacterium]